MNRKASGTAINASTMIMAVSEFAPIVKPTCRVTELMGPSGPSSMIHAIA